MAFVKIWVHAVYGTKNRHPYFAGEIKNLVIAHIRENAVKKNIYVDCIDGYHDHLHTLISLEPDQAISKVMQLIKGECAKWINDNNVTKTHFEWGEEYFAVSVSPSAINKVRGYIKNQEAHHSKKTFLQEYDEFIAAAKREGLL